MIIDIERIPPEGLEISSEFEFLSAYLVDENAVFLEPVAADIIIRCIGEEILIKGTIKTLLSFICGRCLSPYEFPVDSNFDLVYLPEELDLIREQLENEDMKRYFYISSQISLDDIILEQLNLSLSVQRTVRESVPYAGKSSRRDSVIAPLMSPIQGWIN